MGTPALILWKLDESIKQDLYNGSLTKFIKESIRWKFFQTNCIWKALATSNAPIDDSPYDSTCIIVLFQTCQTNVSKSAVDLDLQITYFLSWISLWCSRYMRISELLIFSRTTTTVGSLCLGSLLRNGLNSCVHPSRNIPVY